MRKNVCCQGKVRFVYLMACAWQIRPLLDEELRFDGAETFEAPGAAQAAKAGLTCAHHGPIPATERGEGEGKRGAGRGSGLIEVHVEELLHPWRARSPSPGCGKPPVQAGRHGGFQASL